MAHERGYLTVRATEGDGVRRIILDLTVHNMYYRDIWNLGNIVHGVWEVVF